MKISQNTFYIATFGCKVNQYESQLLEDKYAESGMRRVGTPEEAGLIIINSCTVTAEADRQCRQLIRRLRNAHPEAAITVTGCYANRAPEELTTAARDIEVNERGSSHGSIASFRGHSRAFVKVQDGCDARCTYCIVPKVRPVLWSKPYGQVEEEIKGLVEAGYPEIVLTGIHLGRYDEGVAALMRRLLTLKGRFRFRLSSLEINEVDESLIGLIRDNPEKICPHLHLPLQSGSDHILSRMNRPYDSKKFTVLLEKIKAALPDIALTTDIITGFPGETETHAEETFCFVRNAGFSRLHVFPFSSRSGTPAASMPYKVPGDEIKKRARSLIALGNILQSAYAERFAGSVREAVVEKEKGTLSFLTDNYLSLDAENTSVPDSSLVKVRIIEKEGESSSGGHCMYYGEPIIGFKS